MAPAGTWTWMVLPSKSLGSMSNASALDHTYETAAWALSRMTSPSIPVSTRRSSLLGDEVLRRDAGLLRVRGAGERQEFHPVAQRAWDGVERVAGGDEEDLREVERHAEIGVDEGVVLRRVQHLQQRRGRIAPPVRADLVDLVEHEDGILRLGAAQPLDDAPGDRADVRAAMASVLRLG